VGFFVKLNGEKIEISENTENVIGVVSSENGTSGIIGDDASIRWQGAQQRDSFGRVLYENSYKEPITELLKYSNIDITDEIKSILESDSSDALIEKVSSCELLFKDSSKHPTKEEFLIKLSNVQPIPIVKKNKEYDSTKPYIPRSSRVEWDPIGLMGKVYVRDNGKCKPGEKCDCKNGIAVPGSKWSVLSRSDKNVIRILYK
jgi:hypothetical protein